MKFLHIGLCATGLENPNGLQKAMIRQTSEYREINCGRPDLNAEIARVLAEWTPDLCFIQIQRPGILSDESARLLKSKCFTVNWTGDIRVPTPQWYFDTGALIDLTLFTNLNDVDNLLTKSLNADFLDIGIDPEIYNPVGPKLKNIPEIVFMANNYHEKFPMSKYRRDLVAFMQKEFGPRFGIYGSGWVGGNGSFMNDQRQEAAAYRGAKIGINCSNIEARGYSSDRILRIMGSGALCLSKRYPGIDDDYKNGTHLVNWGTFEELKFYCERYLVEDFERERIARSGSCFIHKTKTFDCMIAGLISFYNKYKK
jgi:hypothetical protein